VKWRFSALYEKPSNIWMGIGQTAYVCVYANRLWNDSGINVGWGQMYKFTVPNGEQWMDGGRLCRADGHASNWLTQPWENLRRVPSANWFQLVGTIGRSTKPAIVIGSTPSEFSPQYPGRLYFFANDLPWMYWSNKGAIAVRVMRAK
jgi:hypothetical protein